MCRLLGWVSRVPTSAAGLLGDDGLADFTELSCVHGDGWGLARTSGDGVQVAKRADAARTSAAFAGVARRWTGELGIAHLRWATLGLDVGPDNTHPFTDGRVALAHNGSVRPPSSLDVLVSPGLRHLRRGNTDSERYFLAVLSRMAEGAVPAEALARTVADVAAAAPAQRQPAGGAPRDAGARDGVARRCAGRLTAGVLSRGSPPRPRRWRAPRR